jgi:hypothetical protein
MILVTTFFESLDRTGKLHIGKQKPGWHKKQNWAWSAKAGLKQE